MTAESKLKGILLAGGAGTRLHPVTRAVSKQLLPVYDKPLVYYPLSSLMLAGIRDVLVVTTPTDREAFKRLLGDGQDFGLRLSYAEQAKPEGIAQALLIGREFLAGGASALALGDNLFYGHGFPDALRAASKRAGGSDEARGERGGATVLACLVKDPQRYGVVEFDASGLAIGIEEKPKAPRSRYAVTGLYFYDGKAPDLAAGLSKSARGEYEITDLNLAYLRAGALHVEILGRGIAWLDTGTHEALLQAANFVQAIEERQGLKVACLEEIALGNGWIGPDDVRRAAARMGGGAYGEYLSRLLDAGPAGR